MDASIELDTIEEPNSFVDELAQATELDRQQRSRECGLTLVKFVVCIGVFFSALVDINKAHAGLISFTNSNLTSVAYRTTADAVVLATGVGVPGQSLNRAVEYNSFSISKFDPSLGTLTSVSIELMGFGDTRHNRIGACESIITLTCGFTVSPTSVAYFGWNVPVVGEGNASPPIIDGVPASPTSDISASQTFSSSRFSLIPIFGEENGPFTGGELSANYILGPAADFIGTDTFDITTEILSETSLSLRCSLAVLAACQGGVLASHNFLSKATVSYSYDEFVVEPPPTHSVSAPSTLPLMASVIGGLAFMSRRRKLPRHEFDVQYTCDIEQCSSTARS